MKTGPNETHEHDNETKRDNGTERENHDEHDDKTERNKTRRKLTNEDGATHPVCVPCLASQTF